MTEDINKIFDKIIEDITMSILETKRNFTKK